MPKLSFIPLSLLIFVFLGINSYAQETGKDKVSLKNILRQTEIRFSVSFSYADSLISPLSCEAPDPDFTLPETLKFLTERTGLTFTRLSDRFIAISFSEKTKEPEIMSVCGTLTDLSTGSAIPYATIRGKTKFTTSDGRGEFLMDITDADQTITISSLGYETLNIPSSALKKCGEVRMNPAVTTLDEIVISAYLTSGIDLTAAGNFKVSTQRLGMLPGLIEADVLQTIQTLPGIQSIQESVSDINIRGGTNDQNQVLWEGIPVFQTGHFFGLISAFNPYLTKDVQVIQHGTPAWYSGGVSGTLDIRSEEDVTNEFHGSVGLNMINGDINAQIPLVKDKASLLFSARRSIADILQTPTYKAYFNRAFQNSDLEVNPGSSRFTTNENFIFDDVTAKIIIQPTDSWKINANFLTTSNSISYSEEAELNGETESRESGLQQSSRAGSISVSGSPSGDITFKGQGYISIYELSATNNDIFNDQRLLQENEVLDWGFRFDGRIRLSPVLFLEGGYHFDETGISNLEDINNPEFRRLIKRVLRTHSVYLEGTFQSLNRNTWLRGGIRGVYLDKFSRFLPEPRLTFRQRISGDLFVELSAERKSQTIVQVIDYQTDFLGIEKRRWLLANEGDIPVLTSNQISGGFQYQSAEWIARVSAYYKEVDDVSTASQGFQNEFQFNRITGSYTVKGVDLLLNVKKKQWNSWVAYTYATNTFSSDSLSPSSFPNTLDIRHTVSSGISRDIKNFTASVGFNWHTGRPYSQAEGFNRAGDIVYQQVNESRLDDYLRLDASVNYKFRLSPRLKAETGLSVWNILDRENVANIYYRRDDNGEIQEVKQLALGITPNMMFRIYF